MLLSLLFSCAVNTPTTQAKLWASISVSKPVFCEDMRREAEFTFAIINDSAQAVAVDLQSSQVLLNGCELKEW